MYIALGQLGQYNYTPVTEISGYIDYGTTSTDVSNITLASEIPVAIKAATTTTNISTTIVIRSTTSISSQNIKYTRNLRF